MSNIEPLKLLVRTFVVSYPAGETDNLYGKLCDAMSKLEKYDGCRILTLASGNVCDKNEKLEEQLYESEEKRMELEKKLETLKRRLAKLASV
jgi:hypothetical protein